MGRPKHFRGESTSPSKGDQEGDSSTCLTCDKTVSENSFECIWCERVQHSECLKINAEQYSGLRDLPTNIVFFCSECLHRLPGALLAFDGMSEVCENIEKKIDSIEESLSNKFASLADQLNDLSTKISCNEQESTTEMAGEDLPPSQGSPSFDDGIYCL